eukprot:COSAG01_NODE_30865_length_608_cov_0.813360_1_plen_135_part_01
MVVPDDFTFTIEYAKSNRSTCRTTLEKIEKGALRIGQMVQSDSFDGRVTQWHCATKAGFFRSGNKGLVTPTQLYNWDELKPTDQRTVEGLIAASLGGAGVCAVCAWCVHVCALHSLKPWCAPRPAALDAAAAAAT